MRLGLETLIGIIDDMHMQCSFWDRQCKKNRKLLQDKLDAIDADKPKP